MSNPLNLFQFLEHRVKKEKIFTVRLFFHVVSLTFCSYNVKNYVDKTEEPIQKTAFIKTSKKSKIQLVRKLNSVRLKKFN